MMTDQKVFIPRFEGPQDNFLSWWAQITAILKATRVWHVEQADGVGSSFSSHQVRASEIGSNVACDTEYVMDVACSMILQGLGKVLFACVMRYQEEQSSMWKLLHEW